MSSRTVLAATMLILLAAPVAAAQPPQADPSLAPADGTPSPEVPMRLDKRCATSGVLGNVDLTRTPPSLQALDLPDAWEFSRGDGVTIAVLDTGVERHFRLPRLAGGGDYIGGGDGLDDCDAHGTLLAGLIAGSTDPADSFSGVAPESRILALRVRSAAYSREGTARRDDPDDSEDAVYARTLARAIVHAANQGAGVIVIPQPACMPAWERFDDATLGAAARYATLEQDAVVVAASGNAIGSCAQNPPYEAPGPSDPRGWARVSTISTPSAYTDHVLSVGLTTLEGLASDQTLQGPWVDIGAPGTGIVTTGTDGASLVNAVQGDNEMHPLAGSAYSTAIVGGVVALVRSRYPSLSAVEVMDRITSTAHHPPRGQDNLLGAGPIDPVAALTHQQPAGSSYGTPGSVALPPLPPPPEHDPWPLRIASTILIVSILAPIAVPALLAILRRRPTS